MGQLQKDIIIIGAGFAGFLGFLMSTFCFPLTLTFLTIGLVGSTGRRATFGLRIG